MRTAITLAMLLFFSAASGQVRISGKVTDQNGIPIAGANIIVQGTYDGASSGEDGTFGFLTEASGEQLLVATYLGYKNFSRGLLIGQQSLEVEVILQETINALEAVTITAGSFTASDASRRTIFKALDIATTAGATADIAGALNTLPGTQKVGESGRLFVRGGDGHETRTFIDGMVVLDAYAAAAPNTPSRGRFLPFMFKGTSFSTGGYSAAYGQALSSALVLDSRDRAEATRTDIGILSVGGDVAHTRAWDRASVAGKIQYTNLRPYAGLISQEIDWINPPVAIEGVGVYRQQVGKTGLVKGYANFNHADFALYNHDIDDSRVKRTYQQAIDYMYFNGTFQGALGRTWGVHSGFSYTLIQDHTQISLDHLRETEKGFHAKVVLDGPLSEKISLKTGAEILRGNDHQSVLRPAVPDSLRGFEETVSALFAEADVYANNNFIVRSGARAEYNTRYSRLSVDPRISLAYRAGAKGQFAVAFGKFRQSPRNSLVRANPALDAEKAVHYIFNYQWVDNKRTFRIETYYKRYEDLVRYVNGNPSMLNNAGSGYARGLELFWRDNRSIKNADYWFSYSFLDTERDYLNHRVSRAPSFASAHNLSLVYKHFIPSLRSQLGLTYSYTTGRNYDDPNREDLKTGRTPYYADLSMNISYLPTPYLILHVSCTNLLGRENIFGYEFSDVADGNGTFKSRAIGQAAPRFLFVGIFITLSKDKSVNQLPTL